MDIGYESVSSHPVWVCVKGFNHIRHNDFLSLPGRSLKGCGEANRCNSNILEKSTSESDETEYIMSHPIIVL